MLNFQWLRTLAFSVPVALQQNKTESYALDFSAMGIFSIRYFFRFPQVFFLSIYLLLTHQYFLLLLEICFYIMPYLWRNQKSQKELASNFSILMTFVNLLALFRNVIQILKRADIFILHFKTKYIELCHSLSSLPGAIVSCLQKY